MMIYDNFDGDNVGVNGYDDDDDDDDVCNG